MQVLFLHDNFPAQFGVFAQYLSQQGWQCYFGTQHQGPTLQGVTKFAYKPHRAGAVETHPYARSFEKSVINAQAAARAMLGLRKRGVEPDIIMAHSGWGPGMFAKSVWPDAKFIGYFEWYYQEDAPDLDYMKDPDRSMDEQLAGQSRNAAILTDLAQCDGAIVPTHFQKTQFPPVFSDLLTVMHDGIDTEYFAPKADRSPLDIDDLVPGEGCEIVTYVARGMEPYRGFPEFMRALERVMAERPNLHAVIVGEDRVAYGRRLGDGDSYKKRMLSDCSLDPARTHFTGLLHRSAYRRVLLASDLHVYLTVPFVLSWSMLEAMSAGCAIIASQTAPVIEIAEQAPGSLAMVDHRDSELIAKGISALLDDRARRKQMGANARALMVGKYAKMQLFAEKADWLRGIGTR